MFVLRSRAVFHEIWWMYPVPEQFFMKSDECTPFPSNFSWNLVIVCRSRAVFHEIWWMYAVPEQFFMKTDNLHLFLEQFYSFCIFFMENFLSFFHYFDCLRLFMFRGLDVLNERRNFVVNSISYMLIRFSFHQLSHQVVYIFSFMRMPCLKVFYCLIKSIALCMFERPSHAFCKFFEEFEVCNTWNS